MTTATQPNTLQTMALVGRSVWIEMLRRKDMYVLTMIVAVYLLGVLAARIVGIENESTAIFLYNLGLTLSHFVAHILTLLFMMRQVPDEIENRTLYPLMAKPVERWQFLLGKWGASVAGGIGVLVLLWVLVFVFVPGGGETTLATLLQAFIAQIVSIGMLAAIVLLLSLLVPKGVNLVVTGILLFFGDKIVGFVSGLFVGSALAPVGRWIVNYVPNFERLDLITRYTDGIGPLGAGAFLGLIAYGLIITAFCGTLSFLIFRQRPL